MTVRIDEPWRERQPFSIDNSLTGPSGNGAYFGNAIAGNPNRAIARRGAGTVHD